MFEILKNTLLLHETTDIIIMKIHFMTHLLCFTAENINSVE